jgi:hypothetical protein
METLENEFNLIDGRFKASETSELLSALFLNKVRFHNIKNFSHQERFGTPDADAEKRIQTLEATLKEVLQFLKDYDQGEEFEIHANVKIKHVNRESSDIDHLIPEESDHRI